jgi:hypothetical protein
MKPLLFRALIASAVAVGFAAFAPLGSATTIEYDSQAGAQAPDGRDVGATAIFSFDATCTTNCNLTITLENTEDMTGISQSLTDFHFTSTSMTGLTLTGADGQQFVNCYHDGVNKPNQFCDAPTDAPFDAGSYGWTLTGSYVLAATPLNQAAIITTPIDPNSDGVSNSQHNPWLIGPVDFFFTYNGSFSVSNVAFSFGSDANTPTVPGSECETNCNDQNVPEPASLALLGAGALALLAKRRRTLQRT